MPYHYEQASGGATGISASGQDDSEQITVTCLLVVGPDGPEYSTCGKTTSYNRNFTLSFADAEAAALALGIHSSLGPVYYVFKCKGAIGNSDLGKKGCISPSNGNDGLGCGDDDGIGSSTSLGVAAGSYSFVEAPAGVGLPEGSAATAQGHIGSDGASEGMPGRGADGCSFVGLLVNPSPIPELTEDMGYAPLLYPKECAFKADQFPTGTFNVGGSNTGAHGKLVSAQIQVIAFVPRPPDPPPPPDPYSVQILFI